ncbi:MAG: DUF4886 domain-containing protein [Clostridia bacterium]|nr:DUF4886 domain-containing protein [Clostridia bacterium]
MRTLSIGNSFSEDATRYLHQIAVSAGVELECVNLYIGGCTLETHAKNVRENNSAYRLEVNGAATGETVSIEDALSRGTYDVITLQQASGFSGKISTYFPHIREVYDLCRKMQPDAEIVMHQTWAYESDSNHGHFHFYGNDQRKMYEHLRNAYRAAADELGMRIIPVGDTVQYLRENVPEFDYMSGGISLNRDGFHLSIPTGRCLAGYVWLETLTGTDCRRADYLPEDGDMALLELVRESVHAALSR